MAGFATYAAARDHLYSLRNRGSKYGLRRMRRLASLLGNPERGLPCVHVAGSNGKGSVCAMLEAAYRGAGHRTGLYTSPHLIHLGERIQVDRRQLDEEAIRGYASEIAAAVERADWHGDPPSFFEWLTAMALLHFARAEVDIALLETGLGGRLDATNIVRPLLAVISSVSLDHTDLLGDSLEAIATEKAGIIKPGVPVAIGWLPPAAEGRIVEVAREREAPLHRVAERFPTADALPETNLAGAFQRRNAALAVLVCELLEDRPGAPADTVRRALRTVDWPGRWQEKRLADRTLILDATHNPEGAVELERNLAARVRQDGARPAVILGVLGRERVPALLQAVLPHADRLYLVAPDQPRAVPPAELAALLPAGAPAASETTLGALFPRPGVCAAGSAGGSIVLCGSIYLVGEALARLAGAGDGGALQDLR